MNLRTLAAIVISLLVFSCNQEGADGPYMATGIKIGEVTQNSAIIWTRLTRNQERVGAEAPMPDIFYKDPESDTLLERGNGRPNLTPVVMYPEGYNVDNIEGAVPGSEGKVRVKYKEINEQEWNTTDWQAVDTAHAYTRQFGLSDLKPGSAYDLVVEASPLNRNKVSASIEGGFKTPPEAETAADLNFIVITCTAYPDADSADGFKLYPSALKLDPEFFVHTGDILYYDHMAKTPELALWHWDRMYSFPTNIEFHRQVSSYFIKDDHDTWRNDCYPGMKSKFMGEFTYEQGTQFFLDEVPMGEKTYRTVRWGKDLQIWMVEGRDYRSPNRMPDGPEKSIWGKEQMEWFKSTVEQSDATFKLLITPTPVVGPDRQNKKDNHANAVFQYEGDMLREFISEQENMYTVCGDRHWQYISKDAETGVMEFGTGSASDSHAGGWPADKKMPEHLYLNVVGGFLEGVISHDTGGPTLNFRYYSPEGDILHEQILQPK